VFVATGLIGAGLGNSVSVGAPVEGSLEALSKILEFAQARGWPDDLASLLSVDLRHRESGLPRRRPRSLPFKPLAG
jgi:hypothetical protein